MATLPARCNEQQSTRTCLFLFCIGHVAVAFVARDVVGGGAAERRLWPLVRPNQALGHHLPQEERVERYQSSTRAMLERTQRFVLDPLVSTSPASSELVLPSSIPDRPTPLESLPVDTIEPTLSSLGLATWWPSGRVQYVMEWLHVDVGLPWYACILATTVTMRLLVFPLVVRSQRNAAMLANNSPKLQALQSKMSDARRRGDLYEASKLGHEMHEFMNTHAMNPLKNMLPMAIQVGIGLNSSA